jgi:hypothetical protein
MNTLTHYNILFADDSSMLLSHSDPTAFNNNINTLFNILSVWFKQNLGSLSFTKTQLKIITKLKKKLISIRILFLLLFMWAG